MSAGLGFGLGMSKGRVAASSIYACYFSCLGRPQVHVFERRDADWISTATISVPYGLDVPLALDPWSFGTTGLLFQGHLIVVGAIMERSPFFGVTTGTPAVDSESELGRGTAYLMEEHAQGWSIAGRLGPPKAEGAVAQASNFGSSVAIDEGTIAVSAPTWTGLSQSVSGVGTISVFGADCSKVKAGSEVPGC